MGNYKRKKHKRFIVISVCCVLLIIICVLLFIDHRLHDRNKPDIFEIPGTEYISTPINETYYDRHYMVQDLPDNEEDIKSMINKYITENDIVKESFSNSVDCVNLHFYTPSISFPVYFEENKNYFKMDDYISHYDDNRFLLVTFDNANSEGKYLFSDE